MIKKFVRDNKAVIVAVVVVTIFAFGVYVGAEGTKELLIAGILKEDSEHENLFHGDRNQVYHN